MIKKTIICVVCAFVGLAAHAKFEFQSISNSGGKTTIEIVDNDFDKSAEICCARFNNDGNTYDATSMVSHLSGNVNKVTMTFKKMTVFNRTSVVLSVNGEDVTIPIDLFTMAYQLSNLYGQDLKLVSPE